MRLLDLRQYRELLTGQAESVHDVDSGAALQYAAEAWPTLGLKPRSLQTRDVTGVVARGGRLFHHIRAFPRKLPETCVVVTEPTLGQGGCDAHILINFAADSARPVLDCPAFHYQGPATAAKIRQMIGRIDPNEDNPFAILARTEGTYLQTLRIDEGYLLEHQLVNVSSHYEVPAPVPGESVTEAMLSYLRGDYQWLEMFDWQKQELA